MDLESELRQLDSNSKLWDRLLDVKKAAKQIWQPPRLHWYTKHGFDHSERVIAMIGRILAPLYSSGKPKEYPQLSADELYILLVACYLHDIGMQNLQVDDRVPVDELTPQHFALIRDRHPHASFLLIRDRTIQPIGRDELRLPLEDNENLMLIARVAQAHGTEFFDESCNELHRLTRFRREPTDPHRVRGELLAALLMMGDELDLRSDRAVFPPDVDLPPESLLHNHKHHYIPDAGVEDGKIPFVRRIFLRFEFPPDAKERDDYFIIRDWVENKLKQQCHRTDSILSKDLQLQWDPDIRVEIDIDTNSYRRKLPLEVFPLLEAKRHELQIAKAESIKQLQETFPSVIQSLHKGIQANKESLKEILAWKETLITEAVNHVLKEYPFLKKPDGSPDSEKIEKFEKSLYECFKLLEKRLRTGMRFSSDKHLEHVKCISESDAYIQAFEFIKKQLSSETPYPSNAESDLLEFIEEIKEYWLENRRL